MVLVDVDRSSGEVTSAVFNLLQRLSKASFISTDDTETVNECFPDGTLTHIYSGTHTLTHTRT